MRHTFVHPRPQVTTGSTLQKKRHAYQRRCSETDRLSLGQPKQELALYLGQVFWDCYISDCKHLLEKTPFRWERRSSCLWIFFF